MSRKNEIDWSLTTWEGSRRAQLRQALAMTLRERLEALDAMTQVAQRLQRMRDEGKLREAPPPKSKN